MIAATPVIYISVIFISGSCTNAEDAADITNTAVGETQTSPLKWTAEQYREKEWSEDLVKHNWFAIEVMEELLLLSKEDLDTLYQMYKENKISPELISKSRGRKKRSNGLERFFMWLGSTMIDFPKVAIFQFMLELLYGKQNNPTCYGDVGCFNRSEGMALRIGGPANPRAVGTKMVLYTRELNYSVKVDDATWEIKYVVNPDIQLTKPLIAIIHGFNIDNEVTWMYRTKDALLKAVDCNVIIVEWLKGAAFPYYAAAAANSAMPGALLSKLLKDMVVTSEGKLKPSMIHVIGFSLGAHAAGLCGRHFYKATKQKLGRITGLDPAGPLFESDSVALSAKDAEFVDIVHTDAGILFFLKLGIKRRLGHVDFYPNGGRNQPGCEALLNVGCSHTRARELFEESISNSRCSFISYPCGSNWRELNAPPEWIKPWQGELGYRSIGKQGRGYQYLETKRQSPYCISKVP